MWALKHLYPEAAYKKLEVKYLPCCFYNCLYCNLKHQKHCQQGMKLFFSGGFKVKNNFILNWMGR